MPASRLDPDDFEPNFQMGWPDPCDCGCESTFISCPHCGDPMAVRRDHLPESVFVHCTFCSGRVLLHREAIFALLSNRPGQVLRGHVIGGTLTPPDPVVAAARAALERAWGLPLVQPVKAPADRPAPNPVANTAKASAEPVERYLGRGTPKVDRQHHAMLIERLLYQIRDTYLPRNPVAQLAQATDGLSVSGRWVTLKVQPRAIGPALLRLNGRPSAVQELSAAIAVRLPGCPVAINLVAVGTMRPAPPEAKRQKLQAWAATGRLYDPSIPPASVSSIYRKVHGRDPQRDGSGTLIYAAMELFHVGLLKPVNDSAEARR